MSNKDSLVIQPNSEDVSLTSLQSDTIFFPKEERQKAIQLLRQIPAFVDVAKKSIEGKTYQAVFSPELLKRMKDGLVKLDEKDDGLFAALIRDVETGQITDHVNLKKVMPDVLSSLNQLAVQQTLADMVHRLEVIDEEITDLLQGQINDRLAEVESGIELYEHAIVAINQETRRELLANAILELNRGRKKLIYSTDFSFLDKLPRNRRGMFFTPIRNICEYVQLKAEPVWKATHGIIKASRYLVLAYSALNEPDSLRVSLEQGKSDVKVFQDKIGEIVRWLPPTINWCQSLTTISQGVLPNTYDVDNIQKKLLS
jgi:hypothetical protein